MVIKKVNHANYSFTDGAEEKNIYCGKFNKVLDYWYLDDEDECYYCVFSSDGEYANNIETYCEYYDLSVEETADVYDVDDQKAAIQELFETNLEFRKLFLEENELQRKVNEKEIEDIEKINGLHEKRNSLKVKLGYYNDKSKGENLSNRELEARYEANLIEYEEQHPEEFEEFEPDEDWWQ